MIQRRQLISDQLSSWNHIGYNFQWSAVFSEPYWLQFSVISCLLGTILVTIFSDQLSSRNHIGYNFQWSAVFLEPYWLQFSVISCLLGTILVTIFSHQLSSRNHIGIFNGAESHWLQFSMGQNHIGYNFQSNCWKIIVIYIVFRSACKYMLTTGIWLKNGEECTTYTDIEDLTRVLMFYWIY